MRVVGGGCKVSMEACEVSENWGNAVRVKVAGGTQVEVFGCTIEGNRASGVVIGGERYGKEEVEYKECQCVKVIKKEERKARSTKAKVRIQGTEVRMNQMNGVEVTEIKKAKKICGAIEIVENIIEDNFCDGIHLRYPRQVKPLPRPLKQLTIALQKN